MGTRGRYLLAAFSTHSSCSRGRSLKRFFETEWDVAAFAIFFIFVGKCIAQHEACTRQLLLVLGLAGSCPNLSNLCSPPSSTIPRRKAGIDNLAMQP
uniref:Uncharacterized protein n=1 Tax=Buteo japonicus TaxID=224669 RepID=A0A8C0BJD9_9AVES